MLKELYEKRSKLISDARAYKKQHEAEWSEERQTAFDAMMADVDKLTQQIRDEERLAAVEAEQAAAAQSEGRTVPPAAPANPTEPRAIAATPEYRDAFIQYLRTANPAELRSMNITVDPSGGYLVPDEFIRTMITALNAYLPMRNYATVITPSGDAKIPVANLDGVAYYIGEEDSYQESDETVAQRALTAHKATNLIKVSEELVQDSAFDIGAFLADRFGTRYAVLEEAAFTTGNGLTRPKGFTLDADTGVTTAVNNDIDPDEVIDLFYSLKAPYRSRAVWQMNDATIKTVRKMKDGAGQYLFSYADRPGGVDSIFGRPVLPNNSMATIAGSAKVMAFGDFSYYWIADRGTPALQRLVELYAATGQIGFRGFKRHDGLLTLGEAVKLLVMHA